MGQRLFEDEGWENLFYWIHENRKIADKIYKLLEDIERNGPTKGIGKPEKLKYRDGWSRRIDSENRLVYDVDENNVVRVISCKGHYE
ncbi:MAG: Txe/YoeB family addiction module toxin [Selenomonadaceae bacterium]|nr:Txe/YoeB family addiction module toxin [Selenomonadaceae bacterium]